MPLTITRPSQRKITSSARRKSLSMRVTRAWTAAASMLRTSRARSSERGAAEICLFIRRIITAGVLRVTDKIPPDSGYLPSLAGRRIIGKYGPGAHFSGFTPYTADSFSDLYVGFQALHLCHIALHQDAGSIVEIHELASHARDRLPGLDRKSVVKECRSR